MLPRKIWFWVYPKISKVKDLNFKIIDEKFKWNTLRTITSPYTGSTYGTYDNTKSWLQNSNFTISENCKNQAMLTNVRTSLKNSSN